MRKLLPLAFAGAILAGCSAGGGEVTTADVKSKEQQAMEATQKLNGGKTPEQGQEQ